MEKKEMLKMLLNQNIDTEDENELIELLIDKNIAVDVDKEDKTKMKFGEKVSDKLTNVAGSWAFIIVFLFFIILWILLNVAIFNNVDPYPFILLNLVLSCIAAIQAPIIMMSQNREAKKDKIRNKNDYRTDLKSELILEELHDQILKLSKSNKEIIKKLEELQAIK